MVWKIFEFLKNRKSKIARRGELTTKATDGGGGASVTKMANIGSEMIRGGDHNSSNRG